MTEVEFSRLLADLSKSTDVLNKKSDSINEIIGRFEQVLRELNPGIEVWLVNYPLASERQLVLSEDDDDEGSTQDDETQLGFVKMGDEWGLAVRIAHYTPDKDDPTNNAPEFLWATHPTPLLKASRRTRIGALAEFPHLIGLIKSEVEEAIRSIDAAEKFVK